MTTKCSFLASRPVRAILLCPQCAGHSTAGMGASHGPCRTPGGDRTLFLSLFSIRCATTCNTLNNTHLYSTYHSVLIYSPQHQREKKFFLEGLPACTEKAARLSSAH
ncbi:hypothetical protein M440DRAFT_1018897 [Trichoderma longibrachiatum ATCC 18648]|uniref:Uncharacterized protein n=1 Tax=Trichoderma longibrachiatum ATCC 18648 TaxID=983965 RepID=A0A2T4CJ40_TRILO|nr:hypothetical protein M440DRAFT_1018897 [Trichoderma longibrachiatum ATCC 18648]